MYTVRRHVLNIRNEICWSCLLPTEKVEGELLHEGPAGWFCQTNARDTMLPICASWYMHLKKQKQLSWYKRVFGEDCGMPDNSVKGYFGWLFDIDNRTGLRNYVRVVGQMYERLLSEKLIAQ